MSFHRANVTWQAPDGTWNIGFYTVIEPDVDDRSEDWDPEWDVDYDETSFEDVYTGRTENDADAAREADRPNPGGSMRYPNTPQNAEEIAQFEAMANALRARTTAATARTTEPATANVPATPATVTAASSAYTGRSLTEIHPAAVEAGDLLLISPDGAAGDGDEYEIVHVGADGWTVVESQRPELPAGWTHFAHEVGYNGPFCFTRLHRLT